MTIIKPSLKLTPVKLAAIVCGLGSLAVAAMLLIPALSIWNREYPLPAVFLPRLNQPVGIVFDTDIGNDIDDALALGLVHALASRGECRLLAVTISKDNPWCAPFCDVVNTFYGRGDIPIGMVRGGKTPQDSRYLREIVQARDAEADRYPHDLRSGADAPEAAGLLRQVLAGQPDQSVIIVVVGFSTNLARLLETPADINSPLTGRDLVKRKCRFLAMMAGMFSSRGRHREFNVVQDVESARKIFTDWPTPIVASGYEIGLAIKYPARSIERDFRSVPHHPLREAYMLYRDMPYDQETWDLTSVLFAVRPDRDYFGLSEPGTIELDERCVTQFTPDLSGRHRYLLISDRQAIRVRESFEQLVSQPPSP